MNPYFPIYTEKTECQDCYKCVRGCPVKAIQVTDGSASVINERCISCGNCIQVCPVGAKHVRNDIERAKRIIELKERVIVSLAPSFVSEFKEYSTSQLIAALKQLGFDEVSETALGAQNVSEKMAHLIEKKNSRILISSACPTIVSLIKKYYPEYSPFIVDLYSPVLAHCKLLKENSGKDTGIVFIGPCVSKKNEADDNDSLLDVVLTFEELRAWLTAENICPENISPEPELIFYPFPAKTGALYPIDGGMLRGIQEFTHQPDVEYMAFSGMTAVLDALDHLDEFQTDKKIILELLACEGGCVNGPKSHSRAGTVHKRINVQNYTAREKTTGQWHHIPNIAHHYPITGIQDAQFTEEQIRDTLRKIGKYKEKDELNCSACGYDNCRDFARAMLEGHAEKSMCASYMRKVATKKANALLKSIPSGVVIIDDQLRIVECNLNFCHLLGEDAETIYEAIPGMEGASLEKLVPFHDYFRHVLETGEDLLNKEIPYKTGGLIGSIFTIEKNGFVGGVFQSSKMPAMHQQQVIQKTRKVIEKNLAVVQQIAYLLGENASETEIMLDSIIKSITTAPPEVEK